MRLFVAINLDNTMKAALKDCITQVQSKGIRANYSLFENLHLTLSFIGERKDFANVKSLVENINFEPFDISIKGCGSFRDVLWVGLEKSKSLDLLAFELNKKLYEGGYIDKIPSFKPHITIARQVSEKVQINVPKASMRVNKIQLMQSRRIGGKLVYSMV